MARVLRTGGRMTVHDFQWLADKIAEHFPDGDEEQALNLLGEAQEALEEAERDQLRGQIRELSEEYLRQNPDLPFR
jgi:hypothetical protein